MLLISKILVSILALIPLFSYAHVETYIEPPKVVTPIKYSIEHNKSVVKEVWGVDSEIGLAIAKCESSFSNLAVNYEDSKLNNHVSRGLFQMSEINGVIPLWHDPKTNAEKAYILYKKNGVRPWYNCAVKNNLLYGSQPLGQSSTSGQT